VFLKQFIERKPFTIIGDGMQMRDFIHVKDVCRAFIKAAELDVQNEVINIGASNPCSIYHLSKMIAGEDYPRQYLPWREGEPKVTYADIRKANRLLNWFPLIKIKDGVEEMLENLSNYADAPLWTEETILEKQTEWNKYLCKQ
jgi:UDP-glucose 4-epimerase